MNKSRNYTVSDVVIFFTPMVILATVGVMALFRLSSIFEMVSIVLGTYLLSFNNFFAFKRYFKKLKQYGWLQSSVTTNTIIGIFAIVCGLTLKI